MNARTLIITAGAIVALAAPTVANAKMLPAKQPTKHAVKKHVTKPNVTKPNVTKGGGKGKAGPTISVYPATVIPATTSLEQIQQDYNNDLLAHGLDAIDFGGAGTPASAPETASTDAAPQAADANLAAAASTTASETVNSTGWDDLYLDC